MDIGTPYSSMQPLITSFQLHINEDIDLSSYGQDIQKEAEKIEIKTWKNETDEQKKKTYRFLVCLNKVNQNFKIIDQKRTGNIITTNLKQPYDFDKVAELYHKLSAVNAISTDTSVIKHSVAEQ
jgi:hypothetical protein